MSKIAIGSYEDAETFRFGYTKKIAVLKSRPAPLIFRFNIMISQRLA